MYAMLFMMIFGVALLLAAGLLVIQKDPRYSIMLAKVRGLKNKTPEEARAIARNIAKYVAIVGLVITVVFGIGYFICVITQV